jgi:hypothetical protein
LVIPELSGIAPNACGYIRLIYPLATVQKNSKFSIIDLSTLLVEGKLNLGFDWSQISAISTQRTAPLQSQLAWDILVMAKEKRIPIHWDLDDMPFQLDEKSHESSYLSVLSRTALEMRNYASIVTVSTPQIHNQIASYYSQVEIYRNALVEGLWSPSTNENLKSILYFGLEAHRSGLEILSNKLHERNIKKLKSINFQIDAVGPLDGNYHPLIKVIPVPNSATTYPRFASWLSERNKSSIGVVYHLSTSFNQGKSAIKALEYSSLGLTTLSNLNQPMIDDPISDYISIVPNDDFIDEMLGLFQDKPSQEMRSRLALEYVLSNRLLTNDTSSMSAFYSKFLESLS